MSSVKNVDFVGMVGAATVFLEGSKQTGKGSIDVQHTSAPVCSSHSPTLTLPYPCKEVQHRLGLLRAKNEDSFAFLIIIFKYKIQRYKCEGCSGGHCTLVQRVLLKTFQKRNVSSPAPVTMASPSGDTACGGRRRDGSLRRGTRTETLL